MSIGIARLPNRRIELGYAEITSNFSTSSTHTTFQDVTSLTTTVTVGARPVIVEFGCDYAQHTTTGGCAAQIVETATVLAIATNFIGVGGYGSPLYCRRRLAPSVGEHTYKVQIRAVTVNATAAIMAGATSPAWLQITEI